MVNSFNCVAEDHALGDGRATKWQEPGSLRGDEVPSHLTNLDSSMRTLV